ncbi:pectate lyase family protein [Qipengyuania zhejiangensis]|uniref:pectate lyase family protein n=1 Tax=Qipengyuania zhejiangensis TaxID=3077782 RepID=UPI002D79C3BF|nr:pectate lyase [Qipengyuania sp. Z2]
MMRLFALVLALATAATGCRSQAEGRAAFIGAEGYGRDARGGLGGQIVKVTTLDDSGPGSLRECIELDGPRVCVFEVAGVIRFTSKRPAIRNGFITIAGETAPGDGITLSHAGGDTGFTPLAIADTHDVIVRHLRMRMDRAGTDRGANDAITIANSRDVIIDHVSTSWALDENIGAWGDNDRLTISRSILAEGIPRHDKCALLASDPKGPQNISFLGNLCAHNGDRNPDVNVPPASCVDVVNNVFYNAQSQFTEVWESYGGSPVNIVGNSYIAGPDTNRGRAAAIDRSIRGSKGPARIYQADNRNIGIPMLTGSVGNALASDPVCPLRIEAVDAEAAYEAVLEEAGAFPRDAVDRRIVGEVRSGGGGIRQSAGTMPELDPGQPYIDSDGDGMADSWERAHGAKVGLHDPWDGIDDAGWTNFDRFLDFAHTQKLTGVSIL